MSGLFGIPNQAWTRANSWFDYYLRDQQTTPMPDMGTVLLDVFNDNSNDVESYDTLEEVTTHNNNFYLDKREALPLVSQSEARGNNNVTTFVRDFKAGQELSSLTTGKSAHINGGIAFVSATVRAVVDFPRHFIMPVIDRVRAGVWVSERMSDTLRIRGVPTMSLTIVPQETTGTLIVYLLDVNNQKEGGLFTYSPYTFKGATAGQATTLTFNITMTAYDLQKEARLGVVVSSHDVLFLDQNTPKSKITFLSGSFLSLPVHK
jgi:predicted acyl esterase